MRHRRSRLAAAAFLSSLAVASVGYPAAANEPTRVELESAISFRKSFGFDVNPSVVRDVAADPAAAREFGTPLTKDEVQEMHRRLKLNDQVDPVAALMRGLPVASGGVYIDQERGGDIVVLLTGPVDSHAGIKDRVRATVSTDVSVRFEEVQWAYADLRALQTRLDDDFDALQQGGIAANYTAVDVPTNLVILGVEDLTDDERDYIQETYGPAVKAEESAGGATAACTRTNCSGERLRGGLAIWNGAGERCTSGFVGREASTLTVTPFVITAGHCANPLTSRADQFHPSSTQIGTVSRINYKDGGYTDVAAFRVSASRVSNYIWRYSDVTTYPVTGIEAEGNQTVGETVLKSGSSSDLRSGKILRTNLHITYGSLDLYGMIEAAVYTLGGDSGGPVFANYKAYGITSGQPFISGTTTPDTSKLWYGPISYGSSAVKVALCFDVSCSSYGGG